jgi:dihydroorotase
MEKKIHKILIFLIGKKYFVDDELIKIRKKFSNLNIILEHVSSKYGADFISENNNMAGTITPQHMLITKKDVFVDDDVNPHNFCMPVAKEEKDLIALRKYACSGNRKFFLGTDSAPHHIKDKVPSLSSKPGIFSSPCSIELYAEIFDQENALNKLESFASINGPIFYKLPVNKNKIKIMKKKWILNEYTTNNKVKIKNFYGGQELNWKVL